MSTIIMMFILPLGIFTYWWDRRNYAQNLELFRTYCDQMRRADCTDNEKIAMIDEMFYRNGYRRIERTDSRLVVEKKHFNIGLLFIAVGLLTYIGLFVYLLYYRFFLRPRRLEIDLQQDVILNNL